MNVQEFKEMVNDWEGYKEKFQLFRNWAENYYKLYCKNRERAYMESVEEYGNLDDFRETEEEQNFFYEWGMVSIGDTIELFSELGIKIDDDFEKIPLREDIFGEFYYPQDFNNLYRVVQEQENDIDFFYGLSILIAQIHESQMIYKEYVVKVKKGIKKYGLQVCEEKIVENKKKAFIAMWFDDSMKKARGQITAAIRSCGYEPMIIDIKEHNNQIVPEIFKEIENSEFVVADLTGQRGGVYYEAGYAVAKNKELILCCKDGEKNHFDVKQVNTIFWKNEQDLKERLVKRIKVTIGICE